MKNTLPILLLFAITISSYAQKVFLPGNYTTQSQETISGLIKITSEDQIVFKANEKSESITLSAKKINSFTITEPFKKYVSLKNTNGQSKFYAYVIESDISLLIINKTYYIHNKSNGVNILEVKKVKKTTDNGVFESTIKSYIGVLSYYSKDCNSIQSEVNSVSYNRKSLSNYIIKLNECNNSEINDFTQDKSVVNLFEIGITAGGNFATFEQRTISGYKTSNPDLGIGIGAFASYSPNITKYNLSFLIGVEYNQKKVDYIYNRPNFPSDRRITHDATVIEPYLTTIYQPFYNKQWIFSPYLGVGTSYGITLSHDVEESYTIFEDIDKYENELDQSFSFMYRIGTFINVKNNKFLAEIVFSDYPYNLIDYGSNFQIKMGYIYSFK